MPVPRVSVRNCDRNPIKPSRRDAKLEPDPAAPVIDHLRHRRPAIAEAGNDDALIVLRNVDHKLLDSVPPLRPSVDRVTISGRDTCTSCPSRRIISIKIDS